MRVRLVLIVLSVLTFLTCQRAVLPPNVVLIITDDQGWGDLGSHGNPYFSTPNIDDIARHGVSFISFYVQPVCSPTRAELLTGRYAARGGVSGTSAGAERLDIDERLIAEDFKDAGYATAAYGKWHNGMQPPYHPNARGFDDFYGFCSGHWGDYFDSPLEHNGRPVRGEGFIADDLTNKAIKFIQGNHDQPFFLYLPLNTPHSPMQVPDEWWSEFASIRLATPHRYDSLEDQIHTRAAYAMCRNIDWNVGRVVAELRAQEVFRNTIVIFMSDNGPNGPRWNANYKGWKGSTDEGGVKSPLLMQWPDQLEAGRVIDGIVGAIDLYPTLLSLARITRTKGFEFDGNDLAPTLLEGQPIPHRVLFNSWNNRVSVRYEQFRLDHSNALYDVDADPGQTRNIADKHTQVFNDLVTQKHDWLNEMREELARSTNRPFTVGHPQCIVTQLPARDGTAEGNVTRSNKYPNCSYFTNWQTHADRVFWPVDVLTSGEYDVTIYTTNPDSSVGAEILVQSSTGQVSMIFADYHDPPLRGAAEDRVPRIESYVKDFRPLRLGQLKLRSGSDTLSLRIRSSNTSSTIDFSTMFLTRLQ